VEIPQFGNIITFRPPLAQVCRQALWAGYLCPESILKILSTLSGKAQERLRSKPSRIPAPAWGIGFHYEAYAASNIYETTE